MSEYIYVTRKKMPSGKEDILLRIRATEEQYLRDAEIGHREGYEVLAATKAPAYLGNKIFNFCESFRQGKLNLGQLLREIELCFVCLN